MATERRWFVVRTNIRCEDRAAKSLRSSGYRVFVPKMRKDIIHHRSKRWITRYFVLFNRYIFVGLPAANMDWFRLRACDGVESVLGIEGKPYQVEREDVADFMRKQRAREFDSRKPPSVTTREQRDAIKKRFKLGAAFRVLRGPWGGFSGQVESVSGKGTIKAMVALFGRLTPVEFPADTIEPVDETEDAA